MISNYTKITSKLKYFMKHPRIWSLCLLAYFFLSIYLCSVGHNPCFTNRYTTGYLRRLSTN